MANPEDENQFWQDEFFFESQDSLLREREKRHHPDTGERITIVYARMVEAVNRLEVVPEAAQGRQENTYVSSAHPEDLSSN